MTRWNQVTGKTISITSKEQDILDGQYLKKHLVIKHKAIALMSKFADIFTTNSEAKVDFTKLVDLTLKMKGQESDKMLGQ